MRCTPGHFMPIGTWPEQLRRASRTLFTEDATCNRRCVWCRSCVGSGTHAGAGGAGGILVNGSGPSARRWRLPRFSAQGGSGVWRRWRCRWTYTARDPVHGSNRVAGGNGAHGLVVCAVYSDQRSNHVSGYVVTEPQSWRGRGDIHGDGGRGGRYTDRQRDVPREAVSIVCGSGFQTFGTVALSGGQATITTTLTSYGGNQSDYTIRAIYSGDGSFQASQSPDFTQDITRPPTTTALTSSLNPSVLSQAVTFTATVTSPGTAPVSGSVRFYNGGAQIGGAVGVNASGQAALTTSALPVGAHVITAQFGSSGGEHASSTSAPLTQSVTLGSGAPTTSTVTSSQNPSLGGDAVTFTVTVAGAGGTPTGNVTFLRSCQYRLRFWISNVRHGGSIRWSGNDNDHAYIVWRQPERLHDQGDL